MVKYIPLFVLISLFFKCQSNSNEDIYEAIDADSLSLIPFPQSLEKGQGYFQMNENVHFSFHDSLNHEAWMIMSGFFDTCTDSPKVNIEPRLNSNICEIVLSDDFKVPNNSPDGYEINITKNRLTLTAKTRAGIRYGIQTLWQMRPQTYSEEAHAYLLPVMKIVDYPAFKHRGLMLDVCRHFFDVGTIMQYVDVLEHYKMNILHLHLTEDQGWRMPIESYPLLNEISSWRLDSNGNKYGGFYSKTELQELVTYAEERNITIIPEIELPGHSQAALAAYPQFSCNGSPIEVVNDWGVFKEIYCAGNDSTFIFLESILTEVMAIFPSEYIHIGGDEAPKFRWEHCDKCQKRMDDEGLKDEHELQAYFIQRIENFLTQNGRKLIGWDEILEGGLSPTAAVQSWRGMDGGKQAAETNHEVVMSPTSHCYLDYSLTSIDLKKVYSFDPIPADLAEEYHSFIIGSEGNMWTEHVPTKADLDAKVFPRLIGLAEVLWTYPEARDFDNFYRRMQDNYDWLEDYYDIAYGLETIGATITQEFSDSGVFIVLNKNLPDLELEYIWQSPRSHGVYQHYETPIKLDKSTALKIQAYKNGEKYGEEIIQYFSEHSGLNKPVSYMTKWNEWYAANKEKALVDGKVGSIDFRDGNWQGFWGEDIDVTIDLGEAQHFLGVEMNFYQYSNSWIFTPKSVSFEISVDGEEWKDQRTKKYSAVDLSNKKSMQNVSFGSDLKLGFYARYIHITAENIGKVPVGHEAAGQASWLFIDEIIIQ